MEHLWSLFLDGAWHRITNAVRKGEPNEDPNLDTRYWVYDTACGLSHDVTPETKDGRREHTCTECNP